MIGSSIGGSVISAEFHGASPNASAKANTANINEALQRAGDNALGGCVSLTRPGRYTVSVQNDILPVGGQSSAVLVIPSNKAGLYLGPGVELFLESSSNTSSTANNHVLTNDDWTNGGSSIAIFGQGTINGNRAGNLNGYYCAIYLYRISYSQINGLALTGVQRATAIEDTFGEAIQIRRSSFNRISNLRVSDCGKDGIKLCTASNYNTVIGNNVEDVDAAGIQIYFGLTGGGDQATCFGNTVTGNNVWADITGAPPFDRRSGIRIHGCAQNVVTGNFCRGVDTVLDILEDAHRNLFANNFGSIRNAGGGCGILIRDVNSDSCDYNIFQSNVFYPFGAAPIIMADVNRGIANRFLDNVWIYNTANPRMADLDANSTDNVFTGNESTGGTPTWVNAGGATNVYASWTTAPIP